MPRSIKLLISSGNLSISFFVDGWSAKLCCQLVIVYKDAVIIGEEAVDIFERSVGRFRIEQESDRDE